MGVYSGVLGFTAKHHPTGATLQAALEIINSVASGEEARLQAFEALSYLLEPVDNANGELLSHVASHDQMDSCTLLVPPALDLRLFWSEPDCRMHLRSRSGF